MFTRSPVPITAGLPWQRPVSQGRRAIRQLQSRLCVLRFTSAPKILIHPCLQPPPSIFRRACSWPRMSKSIKSGRGQLRWRNYQEASPSFPLPCRTTHSHHTRVALFLRHGCRRRVRSAPACSRDYLRPAEPRCRDHCQGPSEAKHSCFVAPHPLLLRAVILFAHNSRSRWAKEISN